MSCIIEGCSRPVENKDTGLCATHSAALRKAARTKEKKVYTIPRVSKKGQQREAALAATTKKMDATMHHVCSSCGTTHSLTHSHILPKSQYPKYAATPMNIVYDCINCHERYEHGTLEQCSSLGNWRHRLNVIQSLAPEYFFRRFGLLISEYRQQTNL